MPGLRRFRIPASEKLMVKQVIVPRPLDELGSDLSDDLPSRRLSAITNLRFSQESDRKLTYRNEFFTAEVQGKIFKIY